jgi:hypothetical protein
LFCRTENCLSYFESFHSQFALDLLLLLSSQKTLAHSTYRCWLFLVKLLST